VGQGEAGIAEQDDRQAFAFRAGCDDEPGAAAIAVKIVPFTGGRAPRALSWAAPARATGSKQSLPPLFASANEVQRGISVCDNRRRRRAFNSGAGPPHPAGGAI